jgi:hypothetical protein
MKTQADEIWLDENVTSYVAGSIPANLNKAQARRECRDCWAEFVQEFGERKNYRAKQVFEWLGY